MSSRGTNLPGANRGPSIFLTGLMGAGKTTVGRLVGEKLGIPFIDSDRIIEVESKKTIAEIFATEGEDVFRRLERDVVMRFTKPGDPEVVGLGGGAVVDPVNRKAILARGVLVWLEASAESILSRIEAEPGKRPLLDSLPTREEKLRKVSQLLGARASSYAEAGIRVCTDGKSPGQVADEVIEKVRKEGSP